MFTFIFDGLNERYRNELEAVRAQHPFKDLRYSRPSLRLTFQEGISLLQEAGYAGAHHVHHLMYALMLPLTPLSCYADACTQLIHWMI